MGLKVNKSILITSLFVLTAVWQVDGKSGIDERKNPSLTVYSNNFALVREQREAELKKGVNVLRVTDIPSGIEPDSVHFRSLNQPDKFSVLEQNYERGFIGSDRILKQNLNKEIIIYPESSDDGESYKGILKGYDEQSLILSLSKFAGEAGAGMAVQSRENIIRMVFPRMSEKFMLTPALNWRIQSDSDAGHLTELTYITSGVKWHATYTCVISENEKNLEIKGWVNIDNRSGTDYENAELKVVAGDINRLGKGEKPIRMYAAKALAETGSADGAGRGFSEEELFEYHIYKLEGLTTIKDNQEKQIELLSGRKVPVNKIFTFDGRYDKDKVRLALEFTNSEENNLGIIMPGGNIKVYKNIGGSVEFIGEDRIGHKPPDEKIRIDVGKAFDIVGKWERISYDKINDRVREEGYRITLRNHKKERVFVVVKEHLWGDWEIKKESHKHKKKDGNTMEFEVEVSPYEEVQIEYSVRIKR